MAVKRPLGYLEKLVQAGALEEGQNLLQTVQNSLQACEQLRGQFR